MPLALQDFGTTFLGKNFGGDEEHLMRKSIPTTKFIFTKN